MPHSPSQQIQEYYDQQAASYNTLFFDHPQAYPTLLYRQAHILKWLKTLPLPKPYRLIDLGCGTGDLIKGLRGDENMLYGVDFSAEMVDIAQKKNSKDIQEGKVIIMQGDVEHLPESMFHQQFDVVVLSGVIEYLPSDELWLPAVKRLLKKDGFLIINITNPYCIRRMTQGFFERLKRFSLVRKIGHAIKAGLLKKGGLHYFDFHIRLHVPARFDQWMETHQFKKKAHHYFDFACLPYPLDKAFERWTLRWKKRMEEVENGRQLLWGGGYIGLYQFTGNENTANLKSTND